MDVDNSLNDSLIIRRSRRGRPVPSNPIKNENEEEETDDKSEEDTRVPRLAGRKRKRKKSSGGAMKRSRLEKHYKTSYSHTCHPVKPLRRSQREKRLLFATFNVSQMDKQILGRADTDISEDELDAYEKLLSPHRVALTSSRHRLNNPPSVASGSASKMAAAKEESGSSSKEESSSEEKAEDADEEGEEGGASEEQGEEVSEEQTEDEDVGGYYNLRKRQPVIYHLKPVHHVVEDDTPPKKRRRRRSLSRHRGSYHSKARAAAPRAYQGRQKGLSGGQSPRKRQAHNDSSSTSSDSDSDEAKFRRRKSRSMAKARSQCLPMNFTPDDLAQGVIRDRIRIGASLADVNPMNIDRSVTFNSIGGLKQHIRALKEMIIFPLLYPEVFDRFQISPPRGVLFHGPPGCGKTLVARALANECSKGGKKVAFFMRKGADCLSKWVGESERQLRLLFDQAYQVRPSIIFFDEIDGLAPVRSSRQDQIHSSIVSTLLALMDGLDSRGEIVVIGATNRIDAIDPALRRPGRFDREFIFPLPSREDRHSILSIDTRGWNPKLKDVFLSELSNSTVGYCGADLRALCTEAALFALRRKYPQIYSTSEKLVLDMSKINVTASDFHNALKSIVPTAQRADCSVALALPEHVRPLYLHFLSDLLNLLCFVFPPSWKLVTKAGSGLDLLLSTEKEAMGKMESRLKELEESVSLGIPSAVKKHLARPKSTSRGAIDAAAAESRDTIRTAHAKKEAELVKQTRSKNRASSIGGSSARSNSDPLSRPSISNWSGGDVLATSNHRSRVDLAGKQRHSWAPNGRGDDGTRCVAASSVYNQLFLKHSKSMFMGDVFFDLTEVSSEGELTDRSISIVVDRNDSSEAGHCSSLQSTSYLNFSSHPHAPPSVHQPRLVLCGKPGMGQSSYLGPALLHTLEDLPVKTMDLTTLFGSSTKTPEEACAQILRELRRVTPSILYLPRLDSWWDVTTETFQVTLFSALSSLLPSTPLLVLATAECQWEQLPEKLKEVFADVGSQTFTVLPPSVEQRRQFFYEVLLEKPFHPPPSKPKLLSDLPLEDLPVASPPKPRELSKEEVSRIVRQREAVLRELRVFLRDATNKLLAERKFKEFVKPVDPEEVPDYHDIITESMDLSTIMKKIDEHRYTLPKQWVADVDLIAKNSLEYNPECNSESRLLRHRAVALQDMAHSFLDHELSEEFDQQCEEIAESFGRIEKTEAFAQFQQQRLKLCPSILSTPRHKETAPTSDSFKSDLYSVPRRSLRQKGVGPEAKGFPYYSPSKTRILKVGSSPGDISLARNNMVGSSEDEEGNDTVSSRTKDVTDGSQSDTGHKQRFELTNSNVRRQIIRPWENSPTPPGSSGQNGMVSSPPESSLDSTSSRGTRRRTTSLQTAAEALVAMATPTKEDQQREEDMVVESYRNGRRISGSPPGRRKRGVSVVLRDVCNGTTSASSSPPAGAGQAQVSVDGRGLVELFEIIVKGTDGCSVEEMERIHTTYQQLVFRHRMSWQREGLLEDLRLTTDLFLQELNVMSS